VIFTTCPRRGTPRLYKHGLFRPSKSAIDHCNGFSN
jgi:hypothetical protein